MLDKTIFHKDRLDFTENNKAQFKGLLVILMINILVINSAANRETTITTTLIIALASISCLIIIILLAIRDRSKDTLAKEIKDIRLKVNFTGNFIVRIRNKKRKFRVIDLGKNHMEVSKYIDFAKANNLQIDFDEKKFAQFVKYPT